MGKMYLVGGAVRDELMGVTPKDWDYVMVGSSVEEMLNSGMQMVGKDFPVFIDPQIGDEVALARTERKTGDGHNGFTVDTAGVTLEEDLMRRDLTINAIAYDPENDEYIDPYGGRADIENKVLRHIPNGAFGDDPLRVLRVARFYATLGFSIHPTTQYLMIQMVERGDLDHLTSERIYKELAKAFHGDANRFYQAIYNIGAEEIIFQPEIMPDRKNFKVGDIATNMVAMFIDADLNILPFTIPNEYVKLIKFMKKYSCFGYAWNDRQDRLQFIRDGKFQHMTQDELDNSKLLQIYVDWNDIGSSDQNLKRIKEDVLKYQSVDVEKALETMSKDGNIRRSIDNLYMDAIR